MPESLTHTTPVTRFAPSTTGRAHPGTLLSGMFVWIWARRHNARLILRLDDLDPQRSSEDFAGRMLNDLSWFGLSWHAVHKQSSPEHQHRYKQTLKTLAKRGLLYTCHCSRKQLRLRCPRAEDGSFLYDGLCRKKVFEHSLFTIEEAATSGTSLRCNLSHIELPDRFGATPSDPVVLRKDGSVAYALATVVDDAHAGVTHILRGRDLLHTTSTQIALQHLLGLHTPHYMHHLLFLENRDHKMAKLHGSVDLGTLKQTYSPAELRKTLAQFVGITVDPAHNVSSIDESLFYADNIMLHWDASDGRLQA